MARSRNGAAIAVILATIGVGPSGPRADGAATESLRRTVGDAASLSILVAGDPRGVRVILVHGTPGSAEGWTDYVLDPPEGVELVALDRPGFGRSAPDGAEVSLAAQAAAVAALLPADGRRAVLLGHSLGGPIVARVAAEHPDRVAALLLLAASLDPDEERIHPMQPVGAWAPVRALLPRAIRNANAELLALRDELVALAPELARVRAPVLIVHGTEDTLVPPANVAYARSRLTGARCVQTRLLQGRDHFLPWNAADEVRAAIRWGVDPSC